MMWQDLVFLAGSTLSIVFLAPTIRNATARVPLGSSVPSMTIGAIYAFTYATMGMTFSAVGSIGVAAMWSLIASYRAPSEETGLRNIAYFYAGQLRRAKRLAADAGGSNDARVEYEQSAD